MKVGKVTDRLNIGWFKLNSVLDKLAAKINPYQPEKLVITDLKPVVVDESNIRKRTLQVMLVFFGAFTVWSTIAPLDAGVHLTGKVSVSGKRKEVAHPGGGVVQEILVAEGNKVQQGQILLRVNPLNTEASLNDATLEYINALAVESRLIAERDEKDSIVWLDELKQLASRDSRVAISQASQEQVFRSGLSARTQERRILNEKIANLRNQLKEHQGVLQIKKKQMETLSQEATNSRSLAEEGYVPLATANEVDRQRSSLLASMSTSVTQIADNQTQIAAGELDLIQRKATFQKEVNEKLNEVQKSRKSLAGRLDSLRFDRALAEVKAPATGVVVGLKANTVGGVIRGGDVLMEIVPEESKLVVEAMVPPVSIDKIRKGMEADMRFTAFNKKTTPKATGNVILVGADLLPTAADGKESYLAIIETNDEGVQALEGLEVQPGMPVDVIVKNGERTFMSYLLKPLLDSFALSFKD